MPGGGVRSQLLNVLVVVKKTAYQQYLARKEAGEVFASVRWDRLRARNERHMRTVDAWEKYSRQRGITYTAVDRDAVTVGDVAGHDMVVTIGGDGTALMAAMSIRGKTPLLGINSDPMHREEAVNLYRTAEKEDPRRSTGFLCGAGPDFEPVFDKILAGQMQPTAVSRIQTEIVLPGAPRHQIRLPPALNDVLLAHPCPAAVSRYSVRVGRRCWFHVRSSGLRVCTAAGATAAMASAGGAPMHPLSTDMQFMDREPIYHDHAPPPSTGRGFYRQGQVMHIRWSSRTGFLYFDGAHVHREIELGTEVLFSTNAPPLMLFRSPRMDEAWSRAGRRQLSLDDMFWFQGS